MDLVGRQIDRNDSKQVRQFLPDLLTSKKWYLGMVASR